MPLQDFVHRIGRSGSPRMDNQGGISRRHQVAANAKIQIQKQTLSHEDHSEQANRNPTQNVIYGNIPTAQPLPPQQLRRRGNHAGESQDAYGTDAGSLDTTFPRGSYVHVEGNQAAGQTILDLGDADSERNRDDGEGSEDGGNNEDENDDDHDFSPDEWRVLEQNGLGNCVFDQQRAWLRLNYRPHKPDRFDGDDSYPPTTSGAPEDFPDNINEDKGFSDEEIEEQGIMSPAPQQPTMKSQPHRHLGNEVPPRPYSEAHRPHLVQKTTNFIKNAAAIRGQTRRDPNVAHPAADSNTAVLLNSQVVQPINPVQRMASHPRSNAWSHGEQHLPQRGATRPKVDPTLLQHENPERTHKPTELPVRPPPTPQPPGEEQDTEPPEDYEPDSLFKMGYDQLKNQSFDTVPRGVPQVLSEDMLQKPLAEQLEHVQKRLDPTDQIKFFRSLPATEWENAGDWFLDQFQNIIKRTKEARQNKRKLAQEFEVEVEKRHKHIEKKQLKVTDALQQMQQQGQGLLRSPMKGN
ncbi:hypothetical protein CC78DRAFT_252453 [Lojkania enalia]|uniref:Extracellular mutant protein 11 C-terminal domain-containing protein n=1 Tax=Lojkania enalia TaxID=147567 RepID=A0A9P4K8H1_9PLEO|nr:hypothetical protein CC78DRAFT_252453 [Didymosphaeria enalia]